MTNNAYTTLAERYIAIWNEPDAARRQSLIAETYADDATYVDPLMEGAGHAGISAMIGAAQRQFPGLQFNLSSAVDAHHDRLRFSWDLGPQGGPAVAKGTDVATVAGGRLQHVIGFLDLMPGG
jgi:hypothetical protein